MEDSKRTFFRADGRYDGLHSLRLRLGLSKPRMDWVAPNWYAYAEHPSKGLCIGVCNRPRDAFFNLCAMAHGYLMFIPPDVPSCP